MPRTKKAPVSQIPVWEAFDTDALKEAWDLWIEFRKEKGFTKYVPTGLKITMTKLRKLASGNEETMIAIIHQSMTGKGWEGFWPLKEEVNIKADLNNLAAHFQPKEEENTPQQSPQPQKATQLEIPVDWSERWEDCQEKAKNGIAPILNVELYDWLQLIGQIVLSKEEKVALFKRAKEKYILELTAGFTPQERHTLLQMKQPGWGNDPVLYERVVKMSKILAVKEALYRSIQKQTHA